MERNSKRRRIDYTSSSYAVQDSSEENLAVVRGADDANSSDDGGGEAGGNIFSSSDECLDDSGAPSRWKYGFKKRKVEVKGGEMRKEELETWDAGIRLVRYWRRLQANNSSLTNSEIRDAEAKLGILDSMKRPKNMMHIIAATKEGEKYLNRILDETSRALETCDEKDIRHAFLSASFASALQVLGRVREAIPYWKRAVESNAVKIHQMWQLRYAQCKLSIANLPTYSSKAAEENTQPMKPTQVPRVRASDLTVDQFMKRYAHSSKPVIITGLLGICWPSIVKNTTTKQSWLHILRRMIGDTKVMLKTSVEGSSEWAQLEEHGEIKFSTFIDAIESKSLPYSQCYCHDWSIPMHCPKLLEDFRIPKYFTGDYLQHSSSGLYKDTWPSLFVGPKGTHSDLHVDAFLSNFWMGLMQGEKKWIFFSKEDMKHLRPQWHSATLDPTFELSPKRPKDLKILTRYCAPQVATLKAGEIIFVPAGSIHFVENLTDTVAISANYIDKTNVHLASERLKIEGIVNSRALELHRWLSNKKNLVKAEKRIESMIRKCESASKNSPASAFSVSWSTFKSQSNVSSNGSQEMKPSSLSDIVAGNSSNYIPPGGRSLDDFLSSYIPPTYKMENKMEIETPPNPEPEVAMKDKNEQKEEKEQRPQVLVLGSVKLRIGRRKRKKKSKQHVSSNYSSTMSYRRSERFFEDNDDDVIGMGYPEALREKGYPRRQSNYD